MPEGLRVESRRWKSPDDFTDRTIIEGASLRFGRNLHGITLVERNLKPGEIKEVQRLVGSLYQIKLKNKYGKGSGDSSFTVLGISSVEPRFKRTIKVYSDPHYPTPPEVIELVRYLPMLAKTS